MKITLTRNWLILIFTVGIAVAGFYIYSIYPPSECDYRHKVTAYDYFDKERDIGSVWVNSNCEVEYSFEEGDLVEYVEDMKDDWIWGSHSYEYSYSQAGFDPSVYDEDGSEHDILNGWPPAEITYNYREGTASIDDEDFYYVILDGMSTEKEFRRKYTFLDQLA
jgi:hypothetical protein